MLRHAWIWKPSPSTSLKDANLTDCESSCHSTSLHAPVATASTESTGFSATDSPLQSSANIGAYPFVGTLYLPALSRDMVIALSPSTTGNVARFLSTILTKSLRYLILCDWYMIGFNLIQSSKFSNSSWIYLCCLALSSWLGWKIWIEYQLPLHEMKLIVQLCEKYYITRAAPFIFWLLSDIITWERCICLCW